VANIVSFHLNTMGKRIIHVPGRAVLEVDGGAPQGLIQTEIANMVVERIQMIGVCVKRNF
jgi:hypothetical protein